MMNFLKTLIAVNKVKFQIDRILRMLININERLQKLEKRDSYSGVEERVQYLEAFINHLEKITFDEKDVAN